MKENHFDPPGVNVWAMEDKVLSAQNRKKQCTKTWSVRDLLVYSEEGKIMLGSTVKV